MFEIEKPESNKTMTPELNTMFSVSLFLALAALCAWNGRRENRKRRYQ